MRGYAMSSERPAPERKMGDQSIEETLRIAIEKATGVSPTIAGVRLYYVRQINGEVDDKKIVYYFEPEFIYVIDIGEKRLALVSLPYQVPTVREGYDYRTIGRGDAEFPEFNEAAVFSGASYDESEILYPAAAGRLIVRAEDDVPEDKLRDALSPYVTDLTKQGMFYLAKVAPFHEPEIADRITSEVDLVRYASLDTQVRNISAGPWWVDRVL